MAPDLPRFCPGCAAIRNGRRWTHDRKIRTRLLADARDGVQVELCSSCRRDRRHIPHGYLHLDGPFVSRHRAAVETLLQREAGAVAGNAGQLLALEDDGGGGLLATTSTEALAARLGDALVREHQGELHYGLSHEMRLSHVWWHR